MEAFTFFGIFIFLIFALILFAVFCVIFLFTDFIPKVRVVFPEYVILPKMPDDPLIFIRGLWSFALFGFFSRDRREKVLDNLLTIRDVRLQERDELDSGIENLHIFLIIFMLLFLLTILWIPVLVVVLFI